LPQITRIDANYFLATPARLIRSGGDYTLAWLKTFRQGFFHTPFVGMN